MISLYVALRFTLVQSSLLHIFFTKEFMAVGFLYVEVARFVNLWVTSSSNYHGLKCIHVLHPFINKIIDSSIWKNYTLMNVAIGWPTSERPHEYMLNFTKDLVRWIILNFRIFLRFALKSPSKQTMRYIEHDTFMFALLSTELVCLWISLSMN